MKFLKICFFIIFAFAPLGSFAASITMSKSEQIELVVKVLGSDTRVLTTKDRGK